MIEGLQKKEQQPNLGLGWLDYRTIITRKAEGSSAEGEVDSAPA